MTKKNLINLFDDLTKYTYIYGYEDDVIEIVNKYLPSRLKRDEFGNYYIKIGNSKTLFCSHIDTVGKQKLKVNKIFFNKNDRNFVKTDGNTILGADNKTGMVIMINMIYHNIPGLYYFLIGEEVGTIGSKLLYEEKPELLENYDRAISFDRKGYGSIINRQMGKYCCSNEFVNELSKEFSKNNLKFQSDSLGVWTDTALFMSIIPECTNLSVGYFNEHTKKESQDLDYMIEMCNAVININWENLPVIRKPIPFDTSEPKKIMKQPNHLPNYKLLSIFEEVDNILYDIIGYFASNSNFFKPGKEMTYFSPKKINDNNLFSVIINWDGSITIIKNGNETKIDDIDEFRIISYLGRLKDFLVNENEVNENKYCNFGCNYISEFIEKNPKFNNEDFINYVTTNNKADRDSGELQDISKEEIERLAKEYNSNKIKKFKDFKK